MKVLIVDDEPQNIELLETMLSIKGYNVVKADNGKSALAALETQDVDLVLLDLQLPDISGIEILKKIRGNPKTKTLPVLMITGLSDKKHKLEGLENGADDYILKPFDMDELFARVETQAKLSYLRRQINEKEKFEKIVTSIDEGVIVTGTGGEILLMNDSAMRLLNVRIGEKHDIKSLISARSMSGIVEANIFERQVLKISDSKYISMFPYQIIDADKKVGSYVLLFRDVTKSHIEEQLKYNFLSFISHKFRTPLTFMGGALELMEQNGNDKNKTLLETVQRGYRDISNLINRLMDYMESHKQGMSEQVGIDKIDGIIEKLKSRYRVDAVVDKNIVVDKLFYWQLLVIEELLDNSFKFRKENAGPKILIEISPERIMIKDNGKGMREEERNKICEPFYQIDEDFTGQVPGAGLGLSFASRLAALNNARIEVESKVNEGSVFSIIIPPTTTPVN